MRSRHIIILIVAALMLVGSFLAGGFREQLKQSLEKETTYPWDLHRQISNLKLDCAKLLSANETAPFFVESLNSEKILLIASYDKLTQSITASAIDINHRHATDKWRVECLDMKSNSK